jgi:hypothetical protein
MGANDERVPMIQGFYCVCCCTGLLPYKFRIQSYNIQSSSFGFFGCRWSLLSTPLCELILRRRHRWTLGGTAHISYDKVKFLFWHVRNYVVVLSKRFHKCSYFVVIWCRSFGRVGAPTDGHCSYEIMLKQSTFQWYSW